MLGSKSSNKKVKQPDQPFTTKEKVDWSSTEGYETMKEVNNFLKWPSVWVNRQDKASREINTRPAKSEQKSKTESRADSAISKPMVVDKPSSKVVSSKPAKGIDSNIKNTKLPPLSKPTKKQHLLEVSTSKVSQKKNHFWQFLAKGWSARKLKKLNQERSRQIKQLSSSGTLSGGQIDSATFQTKEGQRRQVNKVISNKTVAQPLSQEVQPSQPASMPKIEENQENFKNQNKEKQKDKEQEQEKISKPTPKMEAESQNKIKEQRFRDLQQRVEQKSWTRPTITETNLIKGQTTLYFNWRRFWLDLIQWLVITLFFLSLCGVLFYLWRQNQNKQTTDSAQRLAKANQLVILAENEVGDVLDFRLRLMLVSELLNDHIYWSNFFSFLEKNTLPNVFYQDFSGDTGGEYILKARTDNFDSMAKQLKVYRRSADVLEVDSEGGEMVKDEPVVDESGTSSEATTTPTTQLNFFLKLKIKPELFFR